MPKSSVVTRRIKSSDPVESYEESSRAHGVFEEPDTRHGENRNLKEHKYEYLPAHHKN